MSALLKITNTGFARGRSELYRENLYAERSPNFATAQCDQILGQIQQINTKRQELEVAYQQTAGATAGLYEFAPQEEVEEPEVAENGHVPELELAEA